MGEYEHGELQKVLDSPGPLTDIVHSTRLNAQEQRELQGRMEKKQMKEFMTVSLNILCALSSCLSVLLGAHHLQLDVLEAGPEML